ncbi:MAG: restriction endonuclease [Lachnospiraceae bacterium]|nr:restriction endonuclease [Lachnospiraceae bacterium]
MILDYSQFIKISGEEGIVNFQAVNYTMDKLTEKKGFCPFCKKKINNEVYHEMNNNINWCTAVEYEHVVQCPQCGWWEHLYSFSSDDTDQGLRATSSELTQAILRTYDEDSKSVPVEILNKYIAENPEKIYGINDKKMEELVACVFKDFMDCDINLVGKSHDGGKDLILLNGDKQIFVQVKRRTQASKVESVSSIRDLIGASIIGEANACIFVTTADHFSKPAQNAAQKVVEKKVLDSFELIDYHRFVDMLKLQRENYPRQWEQLLQIKKINK